MTAQLKNVDQTDAKVFTFKDEHTIEIKNFKVKSLRFK